MQRIFTPDIPKLTRLKNTKQYHFCLTFEGKNSDIKELIRKEKIMSELNTKRGIFEM